LTPAVEVSAESQAVADLGRFANWRLSNDLALSSTLNAHLSARMSYTTRILNQPVPGFQRTDQVLSASLVLRYVRAAPVVTR
jgi:putative salt-induced outer membrane protein YdiY